MHGRSWCGHYKSIKSKIFIGININIITVIINIIKAEVRIIIVFQCNIKIIR